MKAYKFLAMSPLSLSLLLGWALSVAAQAPAAEPKAEKWTPDDVIMTESVGELRISPDGKWLVWVKSTADKEKDSRVSNLFLSSLVEKKEVQLTRGSYRHSSPRWSPDGQLIAFISDRPLPKENPKAAKSQLWLINPFGGEPWVAAELPRAISSYDWLDNDTVIFAAEEDPTLYEQTIKEKKDTSQPVEDAAHTPPVRLFKLELKNKKVTRLSDNDDWIRSLALSPDGKKVVTLHQRSLSYEFDQKIKPVTFLYDLVTGTRKQLFTDGKVIPFNVRWTPDSQGFYAVSEYSSHPVYRTATISLLYFYDVAQDKVTQVELGWENGLGFGYEVTPDGFIALLAAGVRFKPARYTRHGEGWERAWLEGEHRDNIFGWTLGKDGKSLVYGYTTASRPEQLYRATLDGTRILNPVQLTDINPQFKKKTIAKTEIVRWRGALDEEVEGVLYYPHNYQPGKKYPLILIIHGGPSGVDVDAWDESWGTPQNLLAERGAFVLKGNYHGSGNYGLAWVESIGEGKYYELEVPDLEKGVDYLIARGLVDPERLATMGWSNGAILSIALTTENTRYKACAAGAGDVEWISDWGNVDFGASFDNYYFGKSPLEDPDLYIRKSPFFRMHKVRTPTVIFFGTEDRNVPTSQGWSHYRALQQLERTDVRFVLFPGEPHGLRKLTHQRRKVEEELAWFDKYLFQAAPANEAFKEDSPLGVALKRQVIKKVGTRYGVQEKTVLIPEVVSYRGLELGRFEVTRAQYAAFDKNYRFDPETENYPVNNIPFEQAKAYCAWLSQLTGQTYRLGSEEELEPIYSATKPGENTLDYWAGYNVNPDDAARLLAKVKELPSPAPLLKEVGSFKGVGEEELVFDLGGNVAEWVIDKAGAGKTLGGSADRSADAKAAARPADPLYTGFRVVRGQPKKEGKKP